MRLHLATAIKRPFHNNVEASVLPNFPHSSPVQPSYKLHLNGSQDLITTLEAIRTGFIQMVVQKNIRSTPYIAEARTLYFLASKAATPMELLDIHELQTGLITAAGFSAKAVRTSRLSAEDMRLVLTEFVRDFLAPAGNKFAEELVYRYLLIRGDALGGSMRNLAGALAHKRLLEYIAAGLALAGRPYWWLHRNSRTWMPALETMKFVPEDVGALHWKTDGEHRTLLFNVKLPFIKQAAESDRAGKGVDLCLYACEMDAIKDSSLRRQLVADKSRYLALGELKGGIDPAGADEHWKTASAHLQTRVADAFRERHVRPHLFFIAAAIERSMAEELWSLLETGVLTNVANLTKDEHAIAIAAWLTSL